MRQTISRKGKSRLLVGALASGSLFGCTTGLADGSTSAANGTGSAAMMNGAGAATPTGSSSGGTTSAFGSGGAANEASAPLAARTWRLSHEQYRRSLIDLLGTDPDLANFAPESGNGKFTNFASTALVQVDLAANYYHVAITLATELPTEKLKALTSCPLQAACVDTFIAELGARAFRTEVPVESGSRLKSIFTLAAGDGNAELGFRAVLTAVLNSPLFLYRKEIGPTDVAIGGTFELTDAQTAELLSFSLLDAPPPDWLRARAATAALGVDALPAVVGELMTEPAFEAHLRHFLSEWLEVTRFDTVEKSEVFPGFDQAQPLMSQELAAFFSQSGTAAHSLQSLLLDRVPSVSPVLDQFYYSDASAAAASERLGVLGLGAVLSSHAKSYLTSPTVRGTYIRGRFFCQEINLPANFTPPPLSETEATGVARTTRELYERHQSDASCAGCHELTDNIGFALEGYDGAGRFRTKDSSMGAAVVLDTVAPLLGTDVDRVLSGPHDLSVALSASQEVKDCFARQAFRFYFGQVEPSPEFPAVIAGRQRLLGTGAIGDLIVGLLSTTNTRERLREDK